MGMIIHRTIRDVERCRRKYGEAWRQYEKEVPYLLIPVRTQPLPFKEKDKSMLLLKLTNIAPPVHYLRDRQSKKKMHRLVPNFPLPSPLAPGPK